MRFIHPTAIIYGNVDIEDDVEIGAYCVIGGPPEHRNFYNGEQSYGVRIGTGSRIFPFVTIDAGTKEQTIIGKDTAIFNHSHIGHDCVLGDSVTIGGDVSLAGHTTVLDHATISGKSCTFQRVVIGHHAFIGGMSFITKNVGIAERWIGFPPKFVGYNEIGLSRANLTLEECLKIYGPRFENALKARCP